MTRRACPVTQASIARAIRAAKQTGARTVRVEGSAIVIELDNSHGENPQVVKERLAGDREAVL
jgi:hypothetical protein